MKINKKKIIKILGKNQNNNNNNTYIEVILIKKN